MKERKQRTLRIGTSQFNVQEELAEMVYYIVTKVILCSRAVICT